MREREEKTRALVGLSALHALVDAVPQDGAEASRMVADTIEQYGQDLGRAIRLCRVETEAALIRIRGVMGVGLARELERVARASAREQSTRTRDGRIEPMDDADAATWAGLLMTGSRTDPQPHSDLRNAAHVLRHDPRWIGRIALDEHRGLIEIDGDTLTDNDESKAAIWLAETYGIRVRTPTVSEAIAVVASENRYHPVRDYLDGLEWDGVERLDHWLSDLLDCEDSAMLPVYGRRWLISCVARIYRPGCPADGTLMLSGEQKAGKTSTLKILGGKWYSELSVDLADKDSGLSLQGAWIVEIAELQAFNRSEQNTIKAFLTRDEDRVRPPYGRHFVRLRRQCAFAGTTNDLQFLRDPSGSRRYWPVTVGDVRLDRLREARDQLWAEAVQAFRAGESWVLDREEEQIRASESVRYEVDDPVLERVQAWSAAWKGGPQPLTKIVEHLYPQMPAEKIAGRVSSALRRSGWRRRTVGRPALWEPPGGVG